MRILLFLFVSWLGCGAAFAQAEKVVEIESRGQKIRALLIQPENPAGSVILLAGGHGKLDITADGHITYLGKNQLVRTRAAYAKAGFAVLVPDIAPDMKTRSGVANGYRASNAYAQDLGAAVRYMRSLKNPVVMIGTSRGTLSVANALGWLTQKTERPDAAVMTSGFFAPLSASPFEVRRLVHDKANALNLPTLIVQHRKDACHATSPANVAGFKNWYEKNGRKLDVIWMEGGLPPKGDPCEAFGAHGFYGLDQEVVDRISAWIKAQPLSRP